MDRMSKRTVGLSDRDWTMQWVRWFGANRPKYEMLADTLEQVLKAASASRAPLAIVQTRPKSVASFAEKLQRKITRYRKTDSAGRLLHPITDLCGARVITHTPAEVKAVCGFIEKHFQIDPDNSLDVATRLKTNEFGYLSVHYIVRFRPGVFPTDETPVKAPRAVVGLDAEIQVRTLLEHAWADINHDLSYKSALRVPARWQREFARLAAILEDTDQAFGRIAEGLSAYAANYGAYMSEKQMRDEIDKAQVVLDAAPDNVEVAHRMAKLAICLGDWKPAVKILSEYARPDHPGMLRDLGVAMCKAYKTGGRNFRRGQEYLRRAIELDPADSDAIASLGGTYRGVNNSKALELYRQAFGVNPSDPYPLGNYLEMEIARRKDLSCVSFALPSLRAAIAKCRDQVDVGMNMPWGFYDMGKFRLLLGEPYESLKMHAKAVATSVSTGMIETSLTSIERLRPVASELPGFGWVRRFLRLAVASRSPRGAVGRAVRARASKRRRKIAGPVVIVVGSGESLPKAQTAVYRRMLLAAFRRFTGTVISGGTRSGVARWVGDVGAAYGGRVRTIGYVPRGAKADTDRRRYHEIRRTDGDDFSPAEPLQAWTDILAAGISPRQVRVLGIGGGRIAATEYRVALALGAKVGVLADSGQAVSGLLTDSDWCEAETLYRLPADAMTLRAFVEPTAPPLADDIRETISQAIHEAYRRTKADTLRSADPSMADWPDLPAHLQESNRRQADHIQRKLDMIGCVVRKARKAGSVRVKQLSRREVEALSEIEHGRWNMERISDGWVLGDTKDVAGRISPYLVGWDDLPEDVRDWDRSTVAAIPRFLADVGLEIRPKRR